MINQSPPPANGTAKLYPDIDHPALGELYICHIMAMTAEGLHAKSDIAAQLAWRDAEIAKLRATIMRLTDASEGATDL